MIYTPLIRRLLMLAGLATILAMGSFVLLLARVRMKADAR